MPATAAASRPAVRELEPLARALKVLADAHRLRILTLLLDHGELNVSAIGGHLGQSQPAVSHHLTLLRQAGLIRFRRAGKFNYYAVEPARLRRRKSRDDRRPPTIALGGLRFSLD